MPFVDISSIFSTFCCSAFQTSAWNGSTTMVSCPNAARPGLPDLSWHNIPKPRKIYQNGRTVYQMTIQYTNIFHSKALQNLRKLGFLVWKHIIWQPWARPSAKQTRQSKIDWPYEASK
jgi:hypothetical protein